jgi:hypothetical protein
MEYEGARGIEAKEAFLKAASSVYIAELDMAYLVKRHAEDLFIAGAKERELKGFASLYKKTIDSQDGGVQVVLDLLKKEQASQTNRLLESPYRHNSTCAMSNFQQECELRAKAEFWRNSGFGRGSAANMIHYMEEWLVAETEVLDAYRTHSIR